MVKESLRPGPFEVTRFRSFSHTNQHLKTSHRTSNLKIFPTWTGRFVLVSCWWRLGDSVDVVIVWENAKIFNGRSEPLAAVQGVPLRFADGVNHGIQTVDGDLA